MDVGEIMGKMEDAGIQCDIDYVVYEILDCGVTSRNIEEKSVEDLNITKNRIEALISESYEFIGKINNYIKPKKIFKCDCGFETGSIFEYEEHNDECDQCDGLIY